MHDGSAFAAFNRIPTNDVNRAEQALADGKAVVGDPDLITDGYVSIDLLGMASVEASSSAWAEDTSPDSVHDTTIRDPEVMDSLKVPAVAIESVAGALGSPFISISPATAESLDLEVTYESTVLLMEHDVSTLQAILVSSGTWPVDHDFVDVETPGVDGARAAFTATPIVLSWLLTLGTVLPSCCWPPTSRAATWHDHDGCAARNAGNARHPAAGGAAGRWPACSPAYFLLPCCG